MQSNKKPQIVLVGQIGQGKTTIFNRCCNKNQKVAAGGQSVTRNIYLTDSAYGRGFKILDTPGLGSSSDKLSHVAGIAVALSEGPVHQIIIVIKLDRTDTMLTQLKPMINYQFRKFKDIITVAVTHWDTVTQDIDQSNYKLKQTTEKERILELENLTKSLNVHSLLLVSKHHTGEQICNMIDQVILKTSLTKGRDCYLTEGEIQSFFDLIDISDDAEYLLLSAKDQLTQSFRKKGLAAKGFINSFSDKDPNLADIMHCLTLEFKDEATKLIEGYEKNNKTLFEELYKQIQQDSVFVVYAQLKNNLKSEVEGVIQLAQKKMKLDDRHCYNWIRKCPYQDCRTVWIRVQDCDGLTTCGNFPNQDAHFNQAGSFRKYRFKFEENNVTYNQEKEIQKTQKTYQLKENDKKVGCGRQITWREMPHLQEHELQELYDCGVIDYIRNVDKSRLFEQKSLEQKIKDEMKKTVIIFV